jgi:putative endonuclease
VFYFYLLQSTFDNGLYIGYSSDLKRRLRQHLRGAAPATSYRGPWTLIYYEVYRERADAEGRERFLKSGSGRKLLRKQLVNYFQKNPLAETSELDSSQNSTA